MGAVYDTEIRCLRVRCNHARGLLRFRNDLRGPNSRIERCLGRSWSGPGRHRSGKKEDCLSPEKKQVAPQPKAEPPTDNKHQAKNVWDTEVEDRADDARLAKKLKICNGCSAPQRAGQHPALTPRQSESNQVEAGVKNGAGTQEIPWPSPVSARN